MHDLASGQVAVHNGDVAISGTSIVKIPILLETFRALDEPPTIAEMRLITETATLSGNYTANLLMELIAGRPDPFAGAQEVTESMRGLGFYNTFIAVPYDLSPDPQYFATYATPANQNSEFSTNPDSSMQTTVADMGQLLALIYECSVGRGALLEVYVGAVTAAECREILDVMRHNDIDAFIEEGVPEGIPVAHKHGWVGDTHGDAALVEKEPITVIVSDKGWIRALKGHVEDVSDAKHKEGDKAPSLTLIWTLAAGGADQPGRLWAGTIPGALFRSDDRGDTWHLVESLWQQPSRPEWFGGGYDDPGIHSIVVDPRDSRRITVGVSCGGVWVSEDRGESWTCRAAGMFAEYMPPEGRENPIVQDPHRLVHCPAAPDAMWVQHHNGVFRTRDGARLWTHVPAAAPSGFGFAVAVHPRDPETAWFAPAVKDECRVPVDGRVGAVVHQVGGQGRLGGRQPPDVEVMDGAFEVLGEGLPERDSYDIIYRHALEVDGSGERLAMGSTTGGVWTSDDGGDSWRPLPARLPPVYSLRFAT